MEHTGVVRNYKDTIFRMIFKEPKVLLELFNAINGSAYTNPQELEVVTLENAIYMNMKNDVSCLLDMRLDLYEQQASVNPNMPLRNLMYVAKQYERIILNKDIYARKLIKLPTPKFVVFYNGVEAQPKRRLYRLSDAYEITEDEVSLELIVTQININPGCNDDFMQKCPTLWEYMCYVEKVRLYQKQMPLAEAVPRAVDECIAENILRDFLMRNKSEVISMSIFEYDEELHNKTLRQEGYEDGFDRGIEQGLTRGIEQGLISGIKTGRVEGSVLAYYSLNLPVEEISEKVGISCDEVEKIIAENC